MPLIKQIVFDDFALDLENELLWKGPERIRLRPKTFALLRILAEHSGQLLTKSELLNAIWLDCNVGDEALKHCVAEIRRALQDDAEVPRFVETVHRRGYRFIANTGLRQSESHSHPVDGPQSDQALAGGRHFLVGRSSELSQLHHCLSKAISGVRQVVFISGDQGIGKTSLVDAFLESLNPEGSVHSEEAAGMIPLIARGQCIRSHGAPEAYLPILEAFTGLGRSHEGKRIISLLHHHAPLWLAQMPSLITPARLRDLQRATLGATRERMLREMAETLDALTGDTPMILVLEDLHWSDHSTLDLISYCAQRRGRSRLLLIATCRPSDISAEAYPLKSIKQELEEHEQCRELRIPLLQESAIHEYIQRRFPGNKFPKTIAAWLQRRTGGNPLYMINVLDHLTAQGMILQRQGRWQFVATLADAAQMIPPTIQQVIERQLEHCTSEERRLLQTASVKGEEFSAGGVAAALEAQTAGIDACFQDLARRNLFLQSAGRSAHGNSRFRFAHSLYQSICYRLLSEDQRSRYHQRIAEYIERINPGRPGELAAQLAMHFDLGRQAGRALEYYRKAAENAILRYAGHEAMDLADRGLKLLQTIADDPDRTEHELCLRNALGTALMSTKGAGTEEVRQAFDQARELFQQLSRGQQSKNRSQRFTSLYGLWCYHWIHAEYSSSRNLADQLLEQAKSDRDPLMKDRAHYALGCILMDHGEFRGALEHLRQSSNMLSNCVAAVAQWNLGFPDQALQAMDQALSHAQAIRNPELSIFANLCKARVHMERREYDSALECGRRSLNLAQEQKLSDPSLIPIKTTIAWAIAKLGQTHAGLEQMRQAMALQRSMGVSNLAPLMLCMFAELALDSGHLDEGLSVIEEGLEMARSSGMNHYDAELCRLKGELLFQKIPPQNIADPNNRRFEEASFFIEQAGTIARSQHAKSLELRASISLATHWSRHDRISDAHKRLQQVYEDFTEGLQTADLRQARELLQRWAQTERTPRVLSFESRAAFPR